MKYASIILAALSVAVLAGTATAEEKFLKYGEVEGWKVFVDKEKKSCLIEAIDDAENVVQMGLTQDRGVGYLGVFTKGDTTIKAGVTEAVAIMLGDNIYLGEADRFGPMFASEIRRKRVRQLRVFSKWK